jgi:large subunit ribosomal protein L7/L12
MSLASRCCVRLARSPPLQAALRTAPPAVHARRWNSTSAVAAADPKIADIVDKISGLTLLQTADLVSALKVSALQCPCNCY